MAEKGKCLIFSAPSGSGKSTIVNWLLQYPELRMVFSVSATSRAPRGQEKNGVEYYFLSVDEFRSKIENGEFLEHEEVYPGCFYGTLKKTVEDITSAGNNVVFDVDVKGGCNIKKYFGDRALSMFIQPPSVEELERRLINRGTDSEEMIARRVAKAGYELTFAPQFDVVIVNDVLETAQQEALDTVRRFLNV